MAPRIQTDYNSAEETNACSLRILKRSRKNVSQPKHVSGPNVNEKEEFFRCLGLQMRRVQCPYPTLHGVQHRIEARSRTDGFMLRDCSVVVLGATCNICGKCFKCETDLNVHVALKHSVVHTETVSTAGEHEQQQQQQDDSEVCRRVCEYVKRTDENSATNLQSKLRLIFRIGEEIIVDTTVKRKHLKCHGTVSMATQTEPADTTTTELIMENNTCKGDVPGIDQTVLDNSPCQCCTATICVANGTNRYIAGNFVEKNPIECEEITRRNETRRNDRVAATRETVIFPSNSIPLKSDDVIGNNTNVSYVDSRIPASMKPSSLIGKKCENSRCAESLKSKTSKQLVDSVTVTIQSHSKNSNGSEKLRGSYTEKLLQRTGGINTMQLVMPVILPIIVPHSSRTVADQEEEEPISDDEVQEVLRIVRGSDNIVKEINHESPNRFEQEMLARDVIKDMLRMEQEGWHLLERGDAEAMAKKRRWTYGVKYDARNGVANEITKKKTKYVSSESNIVKTAPNERSITKEPKLQKSSHDKLSISENVKENVLTCNGNISIPLEKLLQYSGNYYADVCEINNNNEATAQEPVSCLFISRSAGSENISNRPTVIDLVNDTDE